LLSLIGAGPDPLHFLHDGVEIEARRLLTNGKVFELSIHFAARACIGTWTNTRSTIHLLYSIDSSPRSKGSARKLKSLGTRRFVNWPCQTPIPLFVCSRKTVFHSLTRMATSCPSSFQ
jgi:hypothetical protein